MRVRVISRKKLVEAAQEHPDLPGPLDAWYRLTKKADWNSLTDVRQLLPSADAVERFTVFNIKGNNYRLIAEINYVTKSVFVRHVLTHREYDKGAWKK